ncbi:MAG: T9SS type A sorting domain-containing protein [candidate division Zixibacteria bacterium]|nr:T9SS type A sorting domain-containing protein [candidate division Zixibacteria bacterium]
MRRKERAFKSLIFSLYFTFFFTLPVLADVSFTELLVDDNVYGTACLYASDLDGDGDLDLIGATKEDHDMVWWRNDGGNPIVWTKFIIDDAFIEALSVYSKDIDGDGDMDVIGAAASSQQIAWWRNEGGEPIQWTKQVLRNGYNWAHEVFADDVDGDGDQDILGVSSVLGLINLWSNEGGDPIQWTEYLIGDELTNAKSVCTSDLDNDGDKDIIGAILGNNDVLWWRNEGGDPIEWTEFTVDGNFAGSHRVQAIDIDNDGDDDILGAAYLGHEIAWWRNNGGDPLHWTKQTIVTYFLNACIAYGADLDGDGDIDVVGSAQASNEVAWWRNDGGDPIVWTEFIIDDEMTRVWPLHVNDLDNDGDKDVIAGSGFRGINEVRWYRNDGITDVNHQDQITPQAHLLHSCYPNPFNSVTTIKFNLQSDEDVKITVYNILGNKVETLLNKKLRAGDHSIQWNTESKMSGVYFYKIAADNEELTGKMILIK